VVRRLIGVGVVDPGNQREINIFRKYDAHAIWQTDH
jgi:hypothetical protein